MSYSDLLKDPRWQKKRLEILERDEWKCCLCHNDKETLHVHHAYYTKGLKPWEYPNKSLCALCASCHARRPGVMNDLLLDLVAVDAEGIASIRGGLVAGQIWNAIYSLQHNEVPRHTEWFIPESTCDPEVQTWAESVWNGLRVNHEVARKFFWPQAKDSPSWTMTIEQAADWLWGRLIWNGSDPTRWESELLWWWHSSNKEQAEQSGTE